MMNPYLLTRLNSSLTPCHKNYPGALTEHSSFPFALTANLSKPSAFAKFALTVYCYCNTDLVDLSDHLRKAIKRYMNSSRTEIYNCTPIRNNGDA